MARRERPLNPFPVPVPTEPDAFQLDALRAAVRDAVREAVEPFADFAGPALTTEQAARYLGISVRSLETLTAAGTLRPVRPTPGCRRFLREALDAHLRACVR